MWTLKPYQDSGKFSIMEAPGCCMAAVAKCWGRSQGPRPCLSALASALACQESLEEEEELGAGRPVRGHLAMQ